MIDIEHAKSEFSDGRFSGPRHLRLLLNEVERLQGEVERLKKALAETKPDTPKK